MTIFRSRKLSSDQKALQEAIRAAQSAGPPPDPMGRLGWVFIEPGEELGQNLSLPGYPIESLEFLDGKLNFRITIPNATANAFSGKKLHSIVVGPDGVKVKESIDTFPRTSLAAGGSHIIMFFISIDAAVVEPDVEKIVESLQKLEIDLL